MTEELQVIVQAMTQLGSEARFAFVAWLIAKYGMHYFTVLAFIGVGAYVACKVVSAVKEHTAAYRIAVAVNQASGTTSGAWFEGSLHFNHCIEWIAKKSEGKS